MLSKMSVMALVSAAGLAWCGAAKAEDAAKAESSVSNYVSLGVGWAAMIDDSELQAPGVPPNEIEYDNGNFGGTVAFGWAFPHNDTLGFRAEAEGGYRQFSMDTLSVGGASTPFGADNTMWTLMGNGYVDWHLNGTWSLYAGLGVGVAFTDHDVALPPTTISGTDTVLAYQAMLGAAVKLDPKWTLTFGYRYFATDDFDADTNSPTTPTVSYKGVAAHILEAGVRWSF